MTLALMSPVNGELAKKRYRHGIGSVSLLRLGQKHSFDLSGTQSDIAENPAGDGIGDNIHSRDTAYMIDPGVTAEPSVERFAATVELG
ncbi:MAG: hypothetical protein WCJ64_09465 [Rhodospirillaceae bacterium]